MCVSSAQTYFYPCTTPMMARIHVDVHSKRIWPLCSSLHIFQALCCCELGVWKLSARLFSAPGSIHLQENFDKREKKTQITFPLRHFSLKIVK
jgi:hypothetical protein